MYETGVTAAAETNKGREGEKDHKGTNDISILPAKELLRNNGWLKTALVLIMGNLGSGVLTIPYAFHLVGFVPGVSLCVIMAVVTRYTGVLLARVFIKNQECHSLGALADRLGGKRYSRLVYSGVYLYLFVCLSYYLVIAAMAIQDIEDMCIYTAALYSGIFILPFFQLRTLGEISYLGIFCFLTIFVVIVICLQTPGDYNAEVTYSSFRISKPSDLFAATGTIGFAYNGQVMYTEMMFEMRDPKEFVTALNINTTILFITYTITGVLGYYRAGDSVPAYLLNVVPSGSMRSTAAVFMIFHLIFTMLPKAQILTRVLHRKLDTASVDAFDRSSKMFLRASIYWFLISIGLFIAMFLVMNTIPFFDDLVVLMGCLFDPCINLITPTVLFWLLLRKSGLLMSVPMMIGWCFIALLVAGLLSFGTINAVSDWVQHTAEIWSCNPS